MSWGTLVVVPSKFYVVKVPLSIVVLMLLLPFHDDLPEVDYLCLKQLALSILHCNFLHLLRGKQSALTLLCVLV